MTLVWLSRKLRRITATAHRWRTGFPTKALWSSFPAIWMPPRYRIWSNSQRMPTCSSLTVLSSTLPVRPRNFTSYTVSRKIGEAARASGVKSLLLSHLAPDVLGQQAAVRKSIRASYAGPVAFASDKQYVPVGK